jgi:hypothetical protein
MEATAGCRASRWRWVAAAIAAMAVLTAAAGASPASAFHIPGGSYSGYVSGGGTITFTVSADGSAVTNLTLTGPITPANCTWSGTQYTQPVPIANNSFDNGQVSGSFPNVQGAAGHYSVVVQSLTGSCRAAGSWSAVTTADPSGSDECKAAQALVKQKKRALHKAKKTGNEKKIRKARGPWAAAKALRDQYC